MTVSRSRCDPCGITCLISIYLIVIYTDYAFIQWIVLPLDVSLWAIVISIGLFQLILLLLVWSHLKASISDPGVVPQPQHKDNGQDLSSNHLFAKKDDNSGHNWSVCSRCQMYRPPRAHHCRICERCVRKMDHHCPWINNCVGELNQKYFILFLVYTGTACIYILLSIIWSFLKSKLDSQQRMIHTSVLLIEALLFGLFVVAVLTDQIQAICANETAIDRYVKSKSQDHKSSSLTTKTTKLKAKKLMTEVCGTGPMVWWLIPCDPNHKYHANNSHFIV
ncbi:palmitoyltransferase ZDHHC3-like [Oppia nitens]|uniref:palmitoyltransferase ZDHHC3-like n=1 Tax=Oppia nitens TaxID=1686743 RepID=UPI0023DB7734|nr:palmitoyltransferase ZDHHC3-like [Oppia nitens]